MVFWSCILSRSFSFSLSFPSSFIFARNRCIRHVVAVLTKLYQIFGLHGLKYHLTCSTFVFGKYAERKHALDLVICNRRNYESETVWIRLRGLQKKYTMFKWQAFEIDAIAVSLTQTRATSCINNMQTHEYMHCFFFGEDRKPTVARTQVLNAYV